MRRDHRAKLEPLNAAFYSGAVGFLGFNATWTCDRDFSPPRWLRDGKLHVQFGGLWLVVADSDPLSGEWARDAAQGALPLLKAGPARRGRTITVVIADMTQTAKKTRSPTTCPVLGGSRAPS